ncbi:MAG: hypothetical protein IJ033_04440 [Clostridia bacterium]|nr:hypothetical protein [Clostridia bacterium]
MLKFGTDGIRARGDLFDDQFLGRFAKAIQKIYGTITLIIARDTRVSGEPIERGLSKHFKALGMGVRLAGVIPTPTLAFLTKSSGCDLGIMISASHNPPEYNGLKLFSGQGAKISLADEKEIEHALNEDLKGSYGVEGWVESMSTDSYVGYLQGIFGNRLKGLKVAVDTCYGSTFSVVPAVFGELGAQLSGINLDPDGSKINVECGATHVEQLLEYCKESECDVAFAYDGDGDRVIAIIDGKVLTGDDVIYLIARYFKLKGMLKSKTVVGTIMSNVGLERALEDKGIAFLRADVGDKYVYEEMVKSGAQIGGEDSGHVILKDYAETGDGLLTSLFIACIQKEIGVSNLLDMAKYPVKEDSLSLSPEQRERFVNTPKIGAFIEEISLKCGVRVVVRPSGTEPKLRIMVEGETYEKAKESALKIKDYLSAELSNNVGLESTKEALKGSQNTSYEKEDYSKFTNNGVVIIDANTTFIARGVKIGRGTTIYPFNYIAGDTVIGQGVNVFSYCDLTDTVIGDGVDIRSTYSLQATIGERSTVGPFATLRKGATIGKGCRIGDYVEVKNSVLGDGVKASHLTYVGDADVGARTNVGCGTVFANYNGKLKRRTEVGEGVFIGCNTNLIAPLKIGDGSYIAGGSTITEDIPSGKFSIARPIQKTMDKR